jgi:ubiquinone/menaquinone biosynthesis C-methylase UbiE
MDPTSSGDRRDYVYDTDRAEEERRLIAQARYLDPLTERVFREAGLGSGMHVLEIGSGAGDVALLVSHLVGPSGSVLGIERSPEAIALSRRRITAAGIDNITFVQGDLSELTAVLDTHDKPFDAVVGRAILMHLPGPAAVLQACAQRLHPGGLVCFQESDVTYECAVPRSPLWEKVQTWILTTAAQLGIEMRMGLKLHQAFRAADLPAPSLRIEALLGSGDAAPVFFWVDIIRGLVPLMEQLGVATAAEVDVDTLSDRLTMETKASDGVVLGPLLVGAWSHTLE